MESLSKAFNRLLHGLIAACLSLMAVFVFANVILRYFFNSGLTWAEEASRYLFIWLIFLGAIIAYKENAHLGVDTLVQKLSVKGRKVLFVVNNLLILITMCLVAEGTWKLTLITMNQNSPSMGLPLAFVYVSGLIASVSMVAISLNNLYRLITGKIDENDLVMITDTEDKEKIEQTVGGSTQGDRKL
ncbi:Tripartite ATP-independent periplasmic transporter, DctQ component [Thermosinus carboxydivorans Nor1]|uniref:Tripartite ATP-independent periplasmic transporter, DctQ component n=1 Tax=Thermosinus carboxydivorans Nor1 TaxID=401526 RepID=A1HSQ0_9FIRM|nr:TRAP transporter small permease [Thermosinus carboxydivorans]EAX46931.1 Tripartite ATP-independent periplasmic transporter, DctQ component [Thermosinus carboxydivorans Nor1]